MDRIINNSFLTIDNFYNNYPAFSKLAINDYQLITAVWNIFLALLPLAFYLILRFYWRRIGFKKIWQKALAFSLFILWLLFFPNTAYIITDIRHLFNYCPLNSPDNVCVDSAWMIIIFFTYACFGWASFYYLLKLMSKLMNEIFSWLKPGRFAALIIPIITLGVLLGLLNRFNSWDVFLYPFWLLKVFPVYFSDIDYFINWFIFTVFFYLLYLAGDFIFKEISDISFNIKRPGK